MAGAWPYWGDVARRPTLPARAERFLRRELGLAGGERGRLAAPGAPVPLDAVTLEPSRLDGSTRARLAAIVGPEHLRDDRETRLRHAAGQSYPDLVAVRSGAVPDAPDAVVLPASHAEVRAVLETCGAARVAVVPFGGGTSVVGGVTPRREGFEGVVTLDLSRLDAVVGIDERSLTATLQAGLVGARAEEALAARGLTLGHFPQSFERATIGGFAATRSAGQASTGYGRFDDLLERVRAATPAGDLDLGRGPASAAGPDLRGLVAGSEGTLGVVTEVTLRVRPAPAARRFEGWALPSFEAGCEALRLLVQSGLAPDVARLSDAAETRATLAQAGGASGTALRGWLRLRRRWGGCLLVCGWEGRAPVVAWRRRHAARALHRHGGLGLGRAVGEAWRAGRFSGPHLRDALLDRGLLVETLETATGWSGLLGLHAAAGRALRAALRSAGVPALVLCHVSHLYPSGASLYYTVLARPRRGEEVAAWRAAKLAASEAVAAAGATITHHHAVGTEHLPWMRREVGALGVEVLRAVKARLDPAGILNPGKLVPPPSGRG